MTKKEQIKAILDDTLKVVVEEADINGKHCIGRKIILGKSEASEKIAALPLDVPGDDEIDAMRFAVFDDVINDIEKAERSGYIKGYKNGKKAMRSEILKRNTP